MQSSQIRPRTAESSWVRGNGKRSCRLSCWACWEHECQNITAYFLHSSQLFPTRSGWCQRRAMTSCRVIVRWHCGERLYQDIKVMENWYQGKLNLSLKSGYCWVLKRDMDVSNAFGHADLILFLSEFTEICFKSLLISFQSKHFKLFWQEKLKFQSV